MPARSRAPAARSRGLSLASGAAMPRSRRPGQDGVRVGVCQRSACGGTWRTDEEGRKSTSAEAGSECTSTLNAKPRRCSAASNSALAPAGAAVAVKRWARAGRPCWLPPCIPYCGASSNRAQGHADRARMREVRGGAVHLLYCATLPVCARGWDQGGPQAGRRAGRVRVKGGSARTATQARSPPRAQSAGCSPACACRTTRAARPASPPAQAPAPWPAAGCSGLKP